MPHHKREWALDQFSLDLLLEQLDVDRERAGEIYTQLHLRLVVFFEGRHAANAEALADETLNRVARRLHEGERVESLPGYALGVARRLLREYYRQPTPESSPLDDALAPNEFAVFRAAERRAQEQAADERRAQCMRRCLSLLDAESRELLRGYFVGDNPAERRRALAAQLDVSANALSLRVFRIREKLGKCCAACLRRPG
jgi:RNA polymerase sigma factor (sigma-70 family)